MSLLCPRGLCGRSLSISMGPALVGLGMAITGIVPIAVQQIYLSHSDLNDYSNPGNNCHQQRVNSTFNLTLQDKNFSHLKNLSDPRNTLDDCAETSYLTKMVIKALLLTFGSAALVGAAWSFYLSINCRVLEIEERFP